MLMAPPPVLIVADAASGVLIVSGLELGLLTVIAVPVAKLVVKIDPELSTNVGVVTLVALLRTLTFLPALITTDPPDDCELNATVPEGVALNVP
jgi:hypothetical protein